MGKLTRDRYKILPQLLLDCRTYDFKVEDALKYIEARLGTKITYAQYNKGMGKLEKGILNNQWLSNFSKVGFALVHQELFSNSLKSYRDTNLKIQKLISFMESERTKEKYEKNFKYYDEQLHKLKSLLMEQGKDVMTYTLGTPVIAQIKAMVRQEIVMQHRDKMLQDGEDLEDANMTIIKNIFESDVRNGNIIIQDMKNNISNPNDSIQRSTEKSTEDRQVPDSERQDTNSSTHDGILPSGERPPQRINPDTNYSIPDSTETQKERERLQQTERDFIC